MVATGMEPGVPRLHKPLSPHSEFFLAGSSAPRPPHPAACSTDTPLPADGRSRESPGPPRRPWAAGNTPAPRHYLLLLLQVLPFALDGKTSLSVVVSISKGPAGPQDIRWTPHQERPVVSDALIFISFDPRYL